MKRILPLLLTALVGSQPALAGEAGQDAAAKLGRLLPATLVDGFAPSPVPGLYEVTAGDQIFYFSPSGHLVFGEIWSQDGRSLTAERREEIVAEKLARLPLDKALTVGHGPRRVIEFTDPDCSFCRTVDDFLGKRDDVTRHIFFYPLESLHPQAAAKARYILCSEDRERAMREVFAGEWDRQEPPSVAGDCREELLDEHWKLGGSLGVRGTPTLWVDGVRIQGANLESLAALLQPRTK